MTRITRIPADFLSVKIRVQKVNLFIYLFLTFGQQRHKGNGSVTGRENVIQDESFFNPALCLQQKRCFRHDMGSSPPTT